MPSKTLTEKLVELIQAPVTAENKEQNSKDIDALFEAVKILSANPRLASASIDTTVISRVNTNPSASNMWNFDLLQMAIFYNKPSAVTGLLDVLKIPVDVVCGDVTPLWVAVAFRRSDLYPLLLTRGANVNFYANSENQKHPTLLHVAAINASYDDTHMLLLMGADPTVKNKVGNKSATPLEVMADVKSDDAEMVKKLLIAGQNLHGAIIDSKDPKGMIAAGQKVDQALLNDPSFTFQYLAQIAHQCAKASNGEGFQQRHFHPRLIMWILPKIEQYIDQGLLDNCDETQLAALVELRNAIKSYKANNTLPKDQQIFSRPEKQAGLIAAFDQAEPKLKEVVAAREEAERQAQEEAARQAREEAESREREAAQKAEKDKKEAAEKAKASSGADPASSTADRDVSPKSTHGKLVEALGAADAASSAPSTPATPDAKRDAASFKALFATPSPSAEVATPPASPAPRHDSDSAPATPPKP